MKMSMTKFEDLKEKFKDKGMYPQEFHWLVLTPPPFEYGKTFGNLKEQREAYKRIVEKVYGEGWDEMSVWIDYQNYK